MSFTDPDYHWIKIRSICYSLVSQLACPANAVPVTDTIAGPEGVETWRLNSDLDVQCLSDEQLMVGGRRLHAELNHLPSHIYSALVEASPTFLQYPEITALYQALCDGGDDFDPVHFASQLKAAVRAGRQPDQQPRLIGVSNYQATFLPDALYVRRTPQNHWMLGLTFRAQAQLQISRPSVQVGLDLGLDPISAVYTNTGEAHFFRPTDLRHLYKVRDLGYLTEPAWLLLQHLIYSSGRADTERVIDFLHTQASAVFAEKLSHRGMSTHFIRKGRDLAIHDFHFSSLSQSLAASHIPFRRVAPEFTSQICAACLARSGNEVRGDRQGDRFTCRKCRTTTNAHTNAAHNVLLRGQQLPARSRPY